MTQLNLLLKFLLELAALAAVGLWGASVTDGPAAVALAVALPVVVAILWGAFAALGVRGQQAVRCSRQ